MAITALVEDHDGEGCEQNDKVVRTHKRVLIATSNSLSDMSYDILTEGQSGGGWGGPLYIPAIYDLHPSDSLSYCNQHSVSRIDAQETRHRFKINVGYTSEIELGGNSNPLLRPVKYWLEWANYSRVAEKDKDGNPIINSAGQPFDPPLVVDDARPVFVAEKNEASSLYDTLLARAITFRNAVNTDTFHGVAARKAKCDSITFGQPKTENGVSYYAVQTRVQFNHELWDFSLLDQGSMHLDVAGGDLVRPIILDGAQKGQPLNDLVLLNTDGTRKTTGSGGYVDFRVFSEQLFSGLGV